MNEIHGARVRRLSATGATDSQGCLVEDGPGYVILRLDANSYPAALSPDEAKAIAKYLRASADRVMLNSREKNWADKS